MMNVSATSVSRKSVLFVSLNEGGEPLQLAVEEDGSLLRTTLAARFREATRLRFRDVDTDTVRGLRFAGDRFHPPAGGWKKCIHFCGGLTKVMQRTSYVGDGITLKHCPTKFCRRPSDIKLSGISAGTTTEHVRDVFAKFGSIAYIKIERGKDELDNGFAYIRYNTRQAYKKVTGASSYVHLVNGQLCPVEMRRTVRNLPMGQKELDCKIFVGGLSYGTKPMDLHAYFAKFGEVNFAYIPPNLTNPYGFVTFRQQSDAHNLMCMKTVHVVNGKVVYLNPAHDSIWPR